MSTDPLAPPKDGSQLLLMGHRGVGTCAEQDLLAKRMPQAMPQRIRENTLRSMRMAHLAGAHFVEFDVQLSRDRVPIVTHNFHLDDGRFVGGLSLAELQALNCSNNYLDGGSSRGQLDVGTEAVEEDEGRFATLESFFRQLPQELGFDVEIKYPRYLLDGTSLCPEFHWSLEEYVAPIVEVVRTLSNEQPRRPVFYSCFVAEICLLLRRLHPDCRVVYLVNHKEGAKYTEVNGVNARAGLEFAASNGLQGVGLQSEELLNSPDPAAGREFVLACQQRGGLRCLTWGPANNTAENRQRQRDWGVCGVIFDNIHATAEASLST